jgi:L-ascorbate metabolism protein UlaG (beta-lactamase superfamily)
MKKFIFGMLLCHAGFSQTYTTQVHYIANEGVLIESGDEKVLIDGLHSYYGDAYMYPDAGTISQMMRGEGIFNGVKLVLVSHIHGDHFDAGMVASFLQNHSQAVLVSSQQVIDSVQKYMQHIDPHRLIYFDLLDQSKKFEIGNISLTVFNLPHSGRRFSWIQNVGNLVEVNGVSFLHTGDASFSTETIKALKMEDRIDVALMPYWYLLDDTQASNIQKFIRPKHFIALHVPPEGGQKYLQEAKKQRPDVIWFSEKGSHYELH